MRRFPSSSSLPVEAQKEIARHKQTLENESKVLREKLDKELKEEKERLEIKQKEYP
jgi:hypothetical protein